MTKQEYVEMLRAHYRMLHKMIVELEKRQEQIHEMLEEFEDQKHFKEGEDDNRKMR